jgi:hypothetical protein
MSAERGPSVISLRIHARIGDALTAMVFPMPSLQLRVHAADQAPPHVRRADVAHDGRMDGAIQFLTLVGQTCADLRQDFILPSDVLGVSALVDALNNPPQGGATDSSVLGLSFTEDALDGECSIGEDQWKRETC